MTDNEPLFDKRDEVWSSLEHATNALAELDDAMRLALKAKAGLNRDDLECVHLAEYHKCLDRIRNDLAYENALLAEQYGHPDWQLDSEED